MFYIGTSCCSIHIMFRLYANTYTDIIIDVYGNIIIVVCDYKLYVTLWGLKCKAHSSLRVSLNKALKIAIYKTFLVIFVL